MAAFHRFRFCAVAAIALTAGADAAPTLKVAIHNGLVSAPAGISFVVNDQAAFVLDVGRMNGSASHFLGATWSADGLNSHPGMAAPDDSIHELTLTAPGGVNLQWDWARAGDAAVARLTVNHPMTVALRLPRETWPGFVSVYTAVSNGAVGAATLPDGQKVAWRLALSTIPTAGKGEILQIKVEPETPLCLVAGLGKLPELAEVDGILGRGERRYQARRPAASGEWGNFVGAIVDNLNNSRVYSSDNHLFVHSVSRAWAAGPNTDPYFCWDSFFNGALACLDDPKTARATVRAILGSATAEGFVPNFAHVNPYEGRNVSIDRSQPPVGALAIWKLQQRWPDKAFLREVYPRLVKWHEWWPAARDGNHDGLLEWGSTDKGLQGARFETGWDDTLHFDGAAMVGSHMNVNAVDLSALWSMDAEYLALIADAIGKKVDAAEFRFEQNQMNQRINDQLWNDKLGLYCSRYWGADGKPGEFLTRLTPMNFYPLICGAPDAARAGRVMEVLTDPKKFWGQWMLPTLAFDDPMWPAQNYWRGKVWAPVNYLVFQGIKRYATPKQEREYARRSVELFMRNWTSRGVCGENYLSSNGDQSSDPHYTWGALLCLIGVESIVDMKADGTIELGRGLPGNVELRNIPLGGRLYRVAVKRGRATFAPERGQ